MAKSNAKIHELQVNEIIAGDGIEKIVSNSIISLDPGLVIFEPNDLITKAYADGIIPSTAISTKTEADIVPASDPPYILFTSDVGVQIPDNANFNIEITGPDGIGIELVGAVYRIVGERRIGNLPEGDFTIVINYK